MVAKTPALSKPKRLAVKKLVQVISRSQRSHERTLLRCFKKLQVIDPPLFERAIQTFDEEELAAMWFGDPIRVLGGVSPFEAIARGKRKAVLEILGRIEHGIYS